MIAPPQEPNQLDVGMKCVFVSESGRDNNQKPTSSSKFKFVFFFLEQVDPETDVIETSNTMKFQHEKPLYVGKDDTEVFFKKPPAARLGQPATQTTNQKKVSANIHNNTSRN